MNGHCEVTELLLQHGARLNHENKVMWSGLRGCGCVGEEFCFVGGMSGIRIWITVPGYSQRLQVVAKVMVAV